MCYVYQTDKFKQAVKGVQFESDITSLITRLEGMTIPEARSLFSFHNPYIKKYIRDKKYRIIAKIKKCENDDVVLCLLDLFQVNSIDYKRFNENALEYGEKHYEHLITDKILIPWTESKKYKGEIANSSSIEIPDELRFWLEPPRYTSLRESAETVIFASKTWVESFGKEEIRDYWKDYFDILEKLVSNDIKSQDIGDNFKIAKNSQRAILFTDLLIDKPSLNLIIFLIAPLSKGYTDNDIHSYRREYEHLKTIDRNNIDSDSIAQLSAQAYPSYILGDDSLWKDIQYNEDANLALSGEEELVLSSILDPDSNESLPVFINGRAGSGKSTLLLYLYSEYLYKIFKVKSEGRNIIGDPLFLTYSSRLNNVARSAVKSLLLNHANYSDSKSSKAVSDKYKDYVENILNSFHTLNELIRNYIPTNRIHDFSSDKYINYSKFKNYYNNTGLSKDSSKYAFKNPAARKYSADLAWHVIRTYITGQSPDDYIDPDEYQSIAVKDRTVSLGNYTEIYHTVWEKWYKELLGNENFWDDQKLLRTVLTQSDIDPVYGAIFCDEAQDFTRLELRFIMNLLIYRKYDFGFSSYRFLPFASAGDPFQTLNPTGFSWSSFKSLFYNEVISFLDPTNTGSIRLNSKELKNNYRSSYPVVRFLNLIQLFRSALDPSRGIESQEGWQTREDDPKPKSFILGTNFSIEQMIHYAKDTTIIVPCEEGQENEFVKNDADLARFLKETDRTAYDLLSPIKAKGLEFKKVILYKFGHYCPHSIYDMIRKRDQLNESDRLELEYFLNKLYVAASRSKYFLFIVDSNKGEQKLWQYFKDKYCITDILSMNNKSGSDDDIAMIYDGIEDNLKDIIETDLPLLAKSMEEKAIEGEDPERFRYASRIYRKLGNNYKADMCEAKALEIEGNYMSAGDIYYRYKYNDKAMELFWKGSCWKKLGNHSDTHGMEGYRSVVIKYYNNADDKIVLINLLMDSLHSLVSDQDLEPLLENQVVNAFKDAFNNMFEYEDKLTDSSFWHRVIIISEFYIENRYSLDNVKLGRLYYNINDYEKCVTIWRKCSDVGKYRRQYHIAQAKVEKIPITKMKYYYNAGEYDQVVAVWSSLEDNYKLKDYDLFNVVYTHLCNNKQYNDAWKLSIKSNRTESIHKLYYKIIETELDDKDYFAYSSQLIDILDKETRWADIFNIIKSNRGKRVSSKNDYKSPFKNTKNKRETKLHALICKYIAHSDTIYKETDDVLSDAYEFMGHLFKDSNITRWRTGLLQIEIDAAFEKIVEPPQALEYYAAIENQPNTNPEVRWFARKRWLVNQMKMIHFYKLVNEPSKAQQEEELFLEYLNRWGISLEEFDKEPSYPKLEWVDLRSDDEISDNNTIDDQLPENITHSDFEIINKRDVGEIIIGHTKSGKSLLINLNTGEMKYSDGEISREKNNGMEYIDIPDFEFEGDLEKYKDNYRIYFTLKGRNFKEHYPHDEE